MRNLTQKEIEILESRKCKSENWDEVFVSEQFDESDLEQIDHIHFSGRIEIGIFRTTFSLPGGVKKHSGLHHATLHNCTLGDNILIEHVQRYIANYTIGEDCFIQHLNLLLVDGQAKFGNQVEVSVLNETGGREVPIYDRLSASLAYIIALYRHRPKLIERLRGMIGDYASAHSSTRGSIGREVKILNAGTIINVKVGDCCTIENTTRLENGSINSNRQAPVTIGDSVIARDFIVSSGSTISDGAKLIRCFVGQSCLVSHSFSAHDSLVFSNCAFENGEACAIFAGPLHRLNA